MTKWDTILITRIGKIDAYGQEKDLYNVMLTTAKDAHYYWAPMDTKRELETRLRQEKVLLPTMVVDLPLETAIKRVEVYKAEGKDYDECKKEIRLSLLDEGHCITYDLAAQIVDIVFFYRNGEE